MSRRVGILTGGGDAPGLNAVIRAFVKRAVGQLGWEVFGIEDSFNGLFSERRNVRSLRPTDCKGLLSMGGTMLGTTNKGDPFAFPQRGVKVDRSHEVVAAMQELGLEGLVCIGGDGTQAIAQRLMKERGVPVLGVPKTIDNDLLSTETTFGFWSAVDVATDALDRLHTTAESHDRVMFLELMGRDAGHIALHAGISGGADLILLPEMPYSPAKVASKVMKRRAIGRTFSIVVVAEGALPDRYAHLSADERRKVLKEGGGAASIAMAELARFAPLDMRVTVLGHLQRGGSPSAFDRLLATRFGVGAVDLVEAGRWGELVALRGGRIVGVSLAEATSGQRFVDPDGELVAAAKAVGTAFGV